MSEKIENLIKYSKISSMIIKDFWGNNSGANRGSERNGAAVREEGRCQHYQLDYLDCQKHRNILKFHENCYVFATLYITKIDHRSQSNCNAFDIWWNVKFTCCDVAVRSGPQHCVDSCDFVAHHVLALHHRKGEERYGTVAGRSFQQFFLPWNFYR